MLITLLTLLIFFMNFLGILLFDRRNPDILLNAELCMLLSMFACFLQIILLIVGAGPNI